MKLITILIAVGLLITGTIMVTTKQYPVAIVNASWVSARDFNQVSIASEQFYVRALETYSKQKPDAAEQSKLETEIRRASIDRLIEQALIQDEAKIEIDGLANKIEEKLKNIDSQKIQNPVREMYGLGIDEFRRQVLEPQATQELLAAALATKGDSLPSHVALSKKSARVILLLPGLTWTEKGVELKK